MSQLQNTQKYGRRNGKAGLGDRIPYEYICSFYQVVHEDERTTLIKSLNDVLGCTCSRTSTILETNFYIVSLAFSTLDAVSICFSPMYNDSAYLRRKLYRKLQRVVASSPICGRERNRFDIVIFEITYDFFHLFTELLFLCGLERFSAS